MVDIRALVTVGVPGSLIHAAMKRQVAFGSQLRKDFQPGVPSRLTLIRVRWRIGKAYSFPSQLFSMALL